MTEQLHDTLNALHRAAVGTKTDDVTDEGLRSQIDREIAKAETALRRARNLAKASADGRVVKIGMGATIHIGSDATAGTVIAIHGANIVEIQEDETTRVDQNGMSDAQSYQYRADPEGRIWTFKLSDDRAQAYEVMETAPGRYRKTGHSARLGLGHRRAFYDYSF